MTAMTVRNNEPNRPRSIALVGFMGSGKTTVGRLVAERLNWPFVDTDARIVAEADGCDIPTLFAREGEVAFRDRETHALRAVCTAEEPQVISTGGGTVLREENVALLREAASVVWLTARPDVVVARTERTAANRPILMRGGSGSDLLAHILTLLGERGPQYQRAAHWIIDTSDRPPRAIVEEILRKRAKG